MKPVSKTSETYRRLAAVGFHNQDPEFLAYIDGRNDALLRRSVEIVAEWSWADRAANACDDDFKSLGALLQAVAAQYRDLPVEIRQAYMAIERLVDAAADQQAENELGETA